MTSISFRAKLFWCILFATLTAFMLPFGYARLMLHDELLQEAREQTLGEARLAARLMRALPEDTPWQSYLEGLGLGTRLTLIAPDGTVLADSALTAAQVAELDNHADRAEFRAALNEGRGLSLRRSSTQDTDLVYGAVRLHNGDVLRVATPFSGLKTRIDGALAALSGVTGVAVLVSLLLAFSLAAWVKSGIGQMVDAVEAISYGRSRRLHHLPGKEFAPLADAVNRMAENIETQLKTVADQKTQLESILDTMNDGVLVLGPQGSVRRCNRAFARTFPGAEEAAGAQVVEIVPDPALQDAVDRMLREPESIDEDGLRLRLALSRDRVFAVHLGRAREQETREESHLGVVAVFHDISDLVRLERIRRDFVANVSHELRTPLTAIQGYAETLSEMDEAPEACRRFGEIIRKHGGYLARMVEELLTLARLENEALPLTLVEVPAQESFTSALGLCRPLLERRGIELEVDVPDTALRISPAEVTQVFRNLLENACRFAPEGSSLRIEARPDELGMMVFRVCDQGPGIPAADLARIFERFYRVEKHRTAPSTGLGLAICKHIVERHGGHIWAESPAEDFATALCFTLPLAEKAV